MNSIPDPRNASLVLDLRNNGGGSTAAVNRIADILLPYCVTNYEISREGIIFPYYSNKASIKVKSTFVLVNGASASASEVLTLALQSYGENITVIGSPTRGKGVGQVTSENKKKQYIIYLVQHY